MEEADEVDHFARIPEELLLLILSRLENLKYLCGCSLVSKRFALTAYQMKSVSLTLPSTEIYSTASADKINELFLKLAGFTSEEVIRFIRSSSIKELKFLSFLQNFRELRSISLDFTCPRSVSCSSLYRVSIIFGSGGAVVENFVSVCKETEQGYDDELGYERICGRQSITGTYLPSGCCTNWLLGLCLLIKCQPLLVDVTIMNCKRQLRCVKKLVPRDKQLVVWRNNFVPGGFLNDFTPYACALGWMCELCFPESYQLRGAKYAIVRLEDESDSDSESDSDAGTDYARTWEYTEEDKLLREAALEFLRQYGYPLCSRTGIFIVLSYGL